MMVRTVGSETAAGGDDATGRAGLRVIESDENGKVSALGFPLMIDRDQH